MRNAFVFLFHDRGEVIDNCIVQTIFLVVSLLFLHLFVAVAVEAHVRSLMVVIVRLKIVELVI